MSNLVAFNQVIQNDKTQNYLLKVLGEKRSSFTNNITALVSNNKALQECEPLSLLYAGIKATALDLPLDSNLGFAYVLPYRNNKENKTEAQFQMGYRGFIQLAIRSGQFKTINVTEIREGEMEDYNLLTGEISFKAKENREDLPVVGYASFFSLTNGFQKVFYMTKKQMQEHALRYSQTYSSKNDYVRNSSKWNTDFDAMAKKTVLKLLLSKYAPLSVEMQNAIQADQAVVREDGQFDYIDNQEGIVESTAEVVVEGGETIQNDAKSKVMESISKQK